MSWDRATLDARIADHAARTRHPAASPDQAEVRAYLAGARPRPGDTVVVLGMTPELRRACLSSDARVVCVDRSDEAIALYRDWVEKRHRYDERVVRGDWLELPRLIDEPVAAVVGDGVFGNLPSLATHGDLLAAIRAVLAPSGRLVTRQALLPRGFDPQRDRMAALARRHRAGLLDDAEFGFAVRLLGHAMCCYDPRTAVLDNARLFDEVDAARATGLLTDAEHSAIHRYVFRGRNVVMPQDRWEALLVQAAFGFEVMRLSGRDWYRYYPVYSCWPT